MPKSKKYDKVKEDAYDPKVPVHMEEAFNYGIKFRAKYIGSMDVPRPSSRVEIVAAMRTVRENFKASGAFKRHVMVQVSIHGVRVKIWTKKTAKDKKKMEEKKDLKKKKSGGRRFSVFRAFRKKKNDPIEKPDSDEKSDSDEKPDPEKKPEEGENPDEGEKPDENLILHHPIHRIFYVSHDSSDLKIFSYIARDGTTNLFKCNVFKSYKSSQAMRIVRTIGQAFDVCHKIQNAPSQDTGAGASTSSAMTEPPPSEPVSDLHATAILDMDVPGDELAIGPLVPMDALLPPPVMFQQPDGDANAEVTGGRAADGTTLSTQQHINLLKDRLDQQVQQTRAALDENNLLREHLAAEQTARCEAQARAQHLLVHNQELLEHISALVAHLQDREPGPLRPIDAHHLTLLPQLSSSDKIDRWFSLLPNAMPALSRPESGFISGMEDGVEASTLAEAKNLLLQLATKKKRRFPHLRFRRKTVANKHTIL